MPGFSWERSNTGVSRRRLLKIHNTYNAGEIDTGITLDSMPFILILAVRAGAVVLFVVKKRRSVEF